MKRLSEALTRVHSTAKDHIIRSKDISRADREILVQGRWLQPIVRGWYLLVRPDAPPGESSAWYASFWDFLGLYLQDLYQDRYCLSAENSLDMHVASTAIPKQVIAIAEKGNNSPLELPFNTSLLTYGAPNQIPEERILLRGVQVMSLPLALCRAGPSYFIKNAKDAEIALRLIKDPSEFLYILIKYDFKRAANRIVGAYLFLGEPDIALHIQKELEKQFFRIVPENPFVETKPYLPLPITSSYAARIYVLWESLRGSIVDQFDPPSPPLKKENYFKKLEKIYTQDAYNSLSIEGYRVSNDLIELIAMKGWNPDGDLQDQQTRDSLAALGYYQAFQSVKESIGRILDGTPASAEVEKNLSLWMRSLFQPLLDAQILRSIDLIGYRRHQVYIRGSRHIPFPREALADAMRAFFDCLAKEPHPAVQAILGHFLLVYIHPYMDGNGRTARFLMNILFAGGGYPWTIIQVKNRDRYFAALESASVENQIEPLVQFILEEMRATEKKLN